MKLYTLQNKDNITRKKHLNFGVFFVLLVIFNGYSPLILVMIKKTEKVDEG